jgi:hypothetical protein
MVLLNLLAYELCACATKHNLLLDSTLSSFTM